MSVSGEGSQWGAVFPERLEAFPPARPHRMWGTGSGYRTIYTQVGPGLTRPHHLAPALVLLGQGSYDDSGALSLPFIGVGSR